MIEEHRDGIPWHQTRVPWRLHWCRPWTTGRLNDYTIQRCACGAIRWGDMDFWTQKNQRRNEARQKAAWQARGQA